MALTPPEITVEELKAKWITDYVPTQDDYVELFDFIENRTPSRKISKTMTLDAWDSEAGYDKTTRIPLVEPTPLKTNVLKRVFVAVELDAGYTINSTPAPDEITLEVYQRGSRIGAFQAKQVDIFWAGNSTGLYEVPIDYISSIQSFENTLIEFALYGKGFPNGEGNQMRVKITGEYIPVDSFGYVTN